MTSGPFLKGDTYVKGASESDDQIKKRMELSVLYYNEGVATVVTVTGDRGCSSAVGDVGVWWRRGVFAHRCTSGFGQRGITIVQPMLPAGLCDRGRLRPGAVRRYDVQPYADRPCPPVPRSG